MNDLSFAVFGGDLRQCYLAEHLYSLGYPVTCCLTSAFNHTPGIQKTSSYEKAIRENTVLIGPVPFADGDFLKCTIGRHLKLSDFFSSLTKKHAVCGGNIPANWITGCLDTNIPVLDVMKSEPLALKNAELTAEGMLVELLKMLPFALRNTPVLLIGFGRCGNALAQKLKALSASVTVCETDRNKERLAASFGFKTCFPSELKRNLSDYKVIINTVPAPVITKELLVTIPEEKRSGIYLFDLASAPGGTDFSAAFNLSVSAFHCLGLPGKYSPQTAGEQIGGEILDWLNILP